MSLGVEIPDASDTAKFEAIAPTLRWMPKIVRENLSPKAAGTLIVTVFLAGGAFTRVVTQSMTLQAANASLQKSQDAQIEVSRKQEEHLAQQDTKLAVILSKMEDIGQRVDEQEQRWQKVESAAEIRIPRRNK